MPQDTMPHLNSQAFLDIAVHDCVLKVVQKQAPKITRKSVQNGPKVAPEASRSAPGHPWERPEAPDSVFGRLWEVFGAPFLAQKPSEVHKMCYLFPAFFQRSFCIRF